MKIHNKHMICLAILLCIEISVMVYFGFQKESFHVDEYFSYYSTSSDDFYIGLQDNTWNPGDIAIRKCSVSLDGRFDYKNVYEMEAKDVHPPLYYYCLHTLCSLFPETFSKWTGLGLNIFFFILSYIVLAKITWMLSDENIMLVLTVNLFYGLNPAVISLVMFIRMYMLLALLLLLFVYVHLRIVQAHYQVKGTELLAIVLISMAGFLTHYYFLIFAGLFSALFAAAVWIESKKFWLAVLNFGSFLLGIGAAVAYYPACIEHIFFGYRGTGAQEAFFDIGNTLYRFRYFSNLISRFAFADKLKEIAVAEVVLVIAAVFGLWKRKRRGTLQKCSSKWTGAWVCLILASFGYYVLIAKTALMNEDEMVRYTVPVYAFLFLIMLAVISLACEILLENRAPVRMIWPVLIAGCLALNLYGMKEESVLFLYPEAEARSDFAKEHSQSVALQVRGNEGWTWEIAGELKEYPEFFCIPGNEISIIDDEKLKNAEEIVAYIDRTDTQIEQSSIQFILDFNENVSGCQKCFETMFYNIYLFQ